MSDDHRPPVISAFSGEHHYLSNAHAARTPFGGNVFPTSAHAFVAAKAAQPDDIHRVTMIPDPFEAGEFGKHIEAVEEWNVLRYQAMEVIVASKFAHNADLGVRLAATMGNLLVYGNTDHDQIWGTCTCPTHIEVEGDNALGVILMTVRMRLAAELSAPDPLERENP